MNPTQPLHLVTTNTGMAAKLDETALRAALENLPGWSVEGEALVKSFTFPSYLAGIDFVHRIAATADKMNHHPDLFVGWKKVKVTLSTHSAGGITEMDLTLAQEAERALQAAAT